MSWADDTPEDTVTGLPPGGVSVSVQRTIIKPPSPKPRVIPVVRIGVSHVKKEMYRQVRHTPLQIKCDRCGGVPGRLEFTETHAQAQSTENPELMLKVGRYCHKCVSVIAPRCQKEGCQGRTNICRSDARYPFSLFCQACMDAYHASLAS